MKIIIRLATYFTFFLFLIILKTNSTLAVTASVSPTSRDENITSVTITYSGLISGSDYKVCLDNDAAPNPWAADSENCEQMSKIIDYPDISGTTLSITVCGDKNDEGDVKLGACGTNDWFLARDDYNVRIYRTENCCDNGTDIANAHFGIKHYIPNPIELLTAGAPRLDSIYTIQVGGHRRPADNSSRNTYDIDSKGIEGTSDPGGPCEGGDPCDFTVGQIGWGEREFGPYETGKYEITLFYNGEDHSKPENLLAKFIITVTEEGGSIVKIGGGSSADDDLTGGVDNNPCTTGLTGICVTALGPIPTTIKGLSEKILSIGMGVAGAFALILIVVGSIRILISQGDQQKLNGGREMIVAAIAGLLFLIFATVILRFIGINILRNVPGIG